MLALSLECFGTILKFLAELGEILAETTIFGNKLPKPLWAENSAFNTAEFRFRPKRKNTPLRGDCTGY